MGGRRLRYLVAELPIVPDWAAPFPRCHRGRAEQALILDRLGRALPVGWDEQRYRLLGIAT